MVEWTETMNSTLNPIDNRRLGDAYAIALLQWPAVIGIWALSNDGWQLILKIGLSAWVVLLSLAVTFGRKEAGTRFGLATILCAVLVAAACAAHPGLWMFLWLFLLMVSFYAAQRAHLQEPFESVDREA
ncbi:MAG: hypothetical protein GY933_04180 [Hyphomicrobiales bacterium]|nr:hypothetical protein [Hyphomicrobiales bacterium]